MKKWQASKADLSPRKEYIPAVDEFDLDDETFAEWFADKWAQLPIETNEQDGEQL